MEKRLIKIDTEIHYLLNELRSTYRKSHKGIEEFRKIKSAVSSKISEPVDPTKIIREMREGKYDIDTGQ